MAYALINSVSASNLSSATTGSIDTTGASLLVMVVACDNLFDQTPTDSKGNTWTQRTSYTNNQPRVRIWDSVPTSVGSGHTFTLGGGGGIVGSIFVSAWSGAHATPFDQQNGANGTGATTLATGSITPSEDNCLVIAGLSFNAAGSPISINGGFTEMNTEIDFGAGDHYGGQHAYLIQTTATAANPTWTRGAGTSGMAATIVSYKAAAVAGGTNSGFFQLL